MTTKKSEFTNQNMKNVINNLFKEGYFDQVDEKTLLRAISDVTNYGHVPTLKTFLKSMLLLGFVESTEHMHIYRIGKKEGE